VLTHTLPPPPPGATLALGVPAVEAEVLVVAPEAAGLPAVLGLNRLPIADSGFAGDAVADGAGDGDASFVLRECFALAGLADAPATGDSAAEAAGVGDASFAFLRERFAFAGLADASGVADSPAAAVGLGDASLAFFLECFALAGLALADASAAGDPLEAGLWANEVATENVATVNARIRRANLFIRGE
jgi:hypothetical protein